MIHRTTSRSLLGTGALVLLLVVLFHPVLFQDKILAPLDIQHETMPPWRESSTTGEAKNHFVADAVTQYLPYRKFAEQSLREDGYIGWNPYEMGGYNLAANTMALPASWPMQAHRWLHFEDAWNLGILAEFLTAGMGMLLFLRSRGLPWLPSMLGSIAFMLNAQFIAWIYHRWALGSFCWLPWVLWSYGKGMPNGEITPRFLLLPIFLSLALLGGTLQHAVYVFIACGCLALGSIHWRRPKSLYQTAAVWSIISLLALSICAFTIVPQVEAYLHNLDIGHRRGGIGYEHGPTQPLYHALIIPLRIWPWLMGDQSTLDGWKLLKSNYMSLNYIGTIPMLLGFIGMFVSGMPKAAKWMMGIGLIIPLTPLVGPLYHRVELVFILGACWMAAELLATLPEWKPAWPWRRMLIGGASIVGVVLLAFALLPDRLDTSLEDKLTSMARAQAAQSNHPVDPVILESRILGWKDRLSIAHPQTAWVYALLLLGCGGLIASASGKRTTAHLGGLMVIMATALELGTLFQNWTSFAPARDLARTHHSISTVAGLTEGGRVFQQTHGTKQTETFATPNLLSSHLIPSVNAYESIQYSSTMRALQEEDPELRLDLAGVRVAIDPDDRPATRGTETWPSQPIHPGWVARNNPEPLPYLATGSGQMPKQPDAIHRSLSQAGQPQLLRHTPNRIALELPSSMDWLRVGHNWHPGWKWRASGGDWRPFSRGQDAACWIGQLPVGVNRMEIQFFPRPAWTSWLSISATGLIAFGLVLLTIRRKQAMSLLATTGPDLA